LRKICVVILVFGSFGLKMAFYESINDKR